MPSRRSYQKCNDFPVRRSTRIARQRGVIDADTEACLLRLGRTIRREAPGEAEDGLVSRLDNRMLASTVIVSNKISQLSEGLHTAINDLNSDIGYIRNRYVAYDIASALHAIVRQANFVVNNGISGLHDVVNDSKFPVFNLPENHPAYPAYSPNYERSPFDGFDSDGEIMCGQPQSPIF